MPAKARWIACSRVVFRRDHTARRCSYPRWIVHERPIFPMVTSRLSCPYDVPFVHVRGGFPRRQGACTRDEEVMDVEGRSLAKARWIACSRVAKTSPRTSGTESAPFRTPPDEDNVATRLGSGAGGDWSNGSRGSLSPCRARALPLTAHTASYRQEDGSPWLLGFSPQSTGPIDTATDLT